MTALMTRVPVPSAVNISDNPRTKSKHIPRVFTTSPSTQFKHWRKTLRNRINTAKKSLFHRFLAKKFEIKIVHAMNLTFLIILSFGMVKAFDLDRLQSLHNQATDAIMAAKNRRMADNRQMAENRHYSRCLRYFQKSQSSNFDLCRRVDQSVSRYNSNDNGRVSIKNNGRELKRYLTWSKYHLQNWIALLRHHFCKTNCRK